MVGVYNQKFTLKIWVKRSYLDEFPIPRHTKKNNNNLVRRVYQGEFATCVVVCPYLRTNDLPLVFLPLYVIVATSCRGMEQRFAFLFFLMKSSYLAKKSSNLLANDRHQDTNTCVNVLATQGNG